MRNYHWARVVVSLVLFIWFVPLSAQGQTPILGRHYVYMDCPNAKDQQCVRLINRRGDPVDAEAFAKVIGLEDAFGLRNINLTSTIAVCRDSVRRDIWHMAKIERVQDRASNIVWANCPESDRRVVTIPGEFYRTSLTADSTLVSLRSAENAARQCGAKPDCIRKAFLSYFPEDGSGPSEATSENPPPTVTPQLAPAPVQSPTASPQNPASVIQPSQVVNQDAGAWTTSDYAILGMSISIGILLIAVGWLWWTRREQRKELTGVKEILAEGDGEIIKQRDTEIERLQELNLKLAKENSGLSEQVTTLRDGVRSLDDQIRQMNVQQQQALSNKEATYQRIMAEKAEENANLASKLAQTLRVLKQLASKYAPEFKGEAVTFEALVKAIESGVVREIITSVQTIYGSDVMEKFPHPLSREEAWKLPALARKEWHKDFVEHVSLIHSMLKSDSVLPSANLSGFDTLNSLRADLLLVMQILRDDLSASNSDIVSAQNPDLFGLLEQYVSALAEMKRRADEWEKAYKRKVASASANADQEPAPVSRPPDTLTGFPVPQKELPSSPNGGGNSGLRLVGKTGA